MISFDWLTIYQPRRVPDGKGGFSQTLARVGSARGRIYAMPWKSNPGDGGAAKFVSRYRVVVEAELADDMVVEENGVKYVLEQVRYDSGFTLADARRQG